LETRKIDLKVGNTNRLELGGLSTAGYTWEYTIDEPKKIVDVTKEIVGDIPKLPSEGPPPDTFERQTVFSITALNPGITHVRILLRRPWEHDISPLKEICLEISVSK